MREQRSGAGDADLRTVAGHALGAGDVVKAAAVEVVVREGHGAGVRGRRLAARVHRPDSIATRRIVTIGSFATNLAPLTDTDITATFSATRRQHPH